MGDGGTEKFSLHNNSKKFLAEDYKHYYEVQNGCRKNQKILRLLSDIFRPLSEFIRGTEKWRKERRGKKKDSIQIRNCCTRPSKLLSFANLINDLFVESWKLKEKNKKPVDGFFLFSHFYSWLHLVSEKRGPQREVCFRASKRLLDFSFLIVCWRNLFGLGEIIF